MHMTFSLWATVPLTLPIKMTPFLTVCGGMLTGQQKEGQDGLKIMHVVLRPVHMVQNKRRCNLEIGW